MLVAELYTAIMKKLLQAVTVSSLFRENFYESQTSSVIMLCAQDFAENTSIPQTALVIKKISNTVTVNEQLCGKFG